MLSLRRKDLVCQQAVELVTDYLEGALSRRDRRRFEFHLRNCPNCTNYVEQIQMTIQLVGNDRTRRTLSRSTRRTHRPLPAVAIRIAPARRCCWGARGGVRCLL